MKHSETVAEHPLASKLRFLKSSEVMVDIAADARPEEKQDRTQTIEIAPNDANQEEKHQKDLIAKMTSFLDVLKSGENQIGARSPAYWGFAGSDDDDSTALPPLGHFINIKATSVLSRGSAEAKPHALLIKPFVLNPMHVYRQAWDLVFVLCSLLYTALRVPYAIAFDVDEFEHIDAWFVLNRCVDVIFGCDVAIIFLTAHKNGRKLVTSRRHIAREYLRSWFFFDLIASIPLDLLLWLSAGSQQGDFSRSTKLIRVIKVFRTLRILRLRKLKGVILTIESFFQLNLNVTGIGKFVIAVCMLAHFLACGFLAVCTDGGFRTGPRGSRSTEYIAGLYWAATSMTVSVLCFVV